MGVTKFLLLFFYYLPIWQVTRINIFGIDIVFPVWFGLVTVKITVIVYQTIVLTWCDAYEPIRSQYIGCRCPVAWSGRPSAKNCFADLQTYVYLLLLLSYNPDNMLFLLHPIMLRYTSEICKQFMFLLWFVNSFTHILQGYFTGTGAIIWLPQCQWSNPEGYG